MTMIAPNPVVGDTAEMPSSKPIDNARTLPLSQIDPPALNPRRDFGDLESLAESIGAVGLLEPVIVRPMRKRFELVAGERRLRAVQLLGWKSIDATVRELDDKKAAEIRLLENRDRASLNPIEEAAAFRTLLDLGHTPESLAELIREGETAVNERLNLLTLPDEWQSRVRKGELSGAAAEYLVPWADRPRARGDGPASGNVADANRGLEKMAGRRRDDSFALTRPAGPGRPAVRRGKEFREARRRHDRRRGAPR